MTTYNFIKKQAGFTLVELLVVIAIIGLLSTIVVVAFGAIRDRARDTAIRANMAQIRLAAELQFEIGNSNYVNTTARPDYIAAVAAITGAGGSIPAANALFSANSFCVRTNLPGGGNWCIDWTGRAGNSPANGCTANAPHNCT